MSSNLKVNTILPSTGTTIGIGTVGGLINVVGNIDVNSTSGISTFNGLEISGIVTAKAGAAVTYYGDGSNLTGITDNVVTINNNANNRVITGSGSANTLEGEANLTFTGSNLTLTNSSGASELTLVTPSNTDGGVYFNDGSNAGAVTYLHTDNSMKFRVNSTNKMIINSSGNVQVNGGAVHIDANGELAVFETDTNLAFTNSSKLAFDFSGNVARIRTSGNGSFTTRPLAFYTGNDERLRIDSAGRVGIKNTNMSSFNTGMDDLVIGNGVSNTSPGMTIFSHATDIGTISFRDSADTGISGLIQYRHLESPPYMRFMVEGTQRMSITTHGGIAFNSDTAAANTLDDYEEGSWTPTFNSNSNGGTFPISTYIRIGRLVSISFHATVGGGSDTSGFKVFGLPFTPDKNGVAPVSTNCNIPCHCRIFDSSNRMEVHKFDSSDVTYQNLSDKFIMINATYRCNP